MGHVKKRCHRVRLKCLSAATSFAMLCTLVGCSGNLLSVHQAWDHAQPTSAVTREAFLGRWELAVQESIKRTVKANKGNGIIPDSDLPWTIQNSFEDMRLFFEFKDDGTYSSHHKTAFSEGDFFGTWKVTDNTLTVQNKKTQKKSIGRIQGKLLQIEHPEGGLTAIYMLQRAN